jgi:predicted transcriptional regulator
MHEEQSSPAQKKEALKSLRKARSQWIADASNQVKHQKKALKAIRDRLGAGAGTIPEIAAATGMQSADVLWYMAALKKYGEIVEAQKDGSYFRYALAPRASQEKS